MHTFCLFWRLLVRLWLLGVVASSFERQVKIVEGVDHPSIVVDSSQIIPPYPPRGPACLSFVLGTCFTLAKADRFEYTVCPFHNVTMKRSSISSSSVLLGLWGGASWQLPDAYVQEYSAGHYCRGPTLYTTLVRYMCFTADGGGSHVDFNPLSTASTYSMASGEAPENQAQPLLPLSLVGFDAVEHGENDEECSFVATIATAFPCSLLASGATRTPPTMVFPHPRSGKSGAGAGAGAGADAVAEAVPSSVTDRQFERLQHQIAVLKAQLAACQSPE